MNRSFPISALLASLIALHPHPASGDAADAPVVRLYGSPAVMEKVFEPARDGLRDSAGVGLFLAGIGESNGLESLINGECEAAMLSSPLEDAVADLSRFGKREIPGGLREHPITSERIWVVVNPANPVRSLSRRDLEDIYLGRITNWRDLGGPDLRIVPVQPPSGTAARRTLIRELLGGNSASLRGIETRGAKDVANYVRFLDGAIGAMPIPNLRRTSRKFRVIGTEIGTRCLVTRGTFPGGGEDPGVPRRGRDADIAPLSSAPSGRGSGRPFLDRKPVGGPHATRAGPPRTTPSCSFPTGRERRSLSGCRPPDQRSPVRLPTVAPSSILERR
jgi:hypothetical protein